MAVAAQKIAKPVYRPLTRRDLDRIPQLSGLDPDEILAIKTVSAVLPFRVNSYIVEQLIDWNDVPEDPIFQLTFPQRGMLSSREFNQIADLIKNRSPINEIKAQAQKIQQNMNPHPAGQMEFNVPRLHGRPLPGMQHKYRETVLFFPSQGQTCHAYCTYCFRWPQFVGMDELKFASHDATLLKSYVSQHKEITDVLFTGGDPMIMKTEKWRIYLESLLDIEHLINIRIGTKALAYWPYRFLTDDDANDFLRLIERVTKAGKQVAIMAHVSHPRELKTRAAQEAIRRLKSTGALIRSQAPLIRHVNDHSQVWADMWRLQLRLGVIPYYMFIERDTGPKNYFEIPLFRCYEIFQEAYRKISGLGRTVRGPSMSTTPGKVVVEGITKIHGEKVFVLTMIQGRNPRWTKIPFFAKYDEKAAWLTDLKPAFGKKEFFFKQEMDIIKKTRKAPAWSQPLLAKKVKDPTLFGHVEWE